MKKYFFFAILAFFHLHLSAQFIKENNECIGFDKLILGAPITNFTVTPINNGKYQKDGREFTIYGYGGEPIELLGNKFNSTLVIFNDSNQLVNFSFIKFHRKNDMKRFEKEAKKYYEQIKTFITGQLNKEGEKKTYFTSKNISHTGYEWKYTTSLLKLTITTSLYNSTVEISFETLGN